MPDTTSTQLVASYGRDLAAGAHDMTTARFVRKVLDDTHVLFAGADHVSVTVRSPSGEWRTLGASTGLATALDLVQYRNADGPCVQASSRGGVLSSGDLGHEDRWPAWSSAAAYLGVRSVLSLSLALKGPFGSLNLYGASRDAFSDPEVSELGHVWAAYVVEGLYAISELDVRPTASMPSPRTP